MSKYDSELGISTSIVRPVLTLLEQLGLDVTREMRDLTAASWEIVPGWIADGWMRTAAERLGDESLGITLAKRLPIGALDLFDFALSTSASLREALQRVARHYGVATERLRLRLEEQPPHADLIFDRRTETANRHWVELAVALIGERMRQTISDQITFHAEFVHAGPASTKAHDDFFGHPTRFLASRDALRFDATWLDCPMSSASKALAELLDARLVELAAASSSADPFVERVRQAIGRGLDGKDTRVESTLAILGVSQSELDQALDRCRASYPQLLDEVRRSRAARLLDEGVSVDEVASRLGFSEPTAFFRTFRRWTGTSPRPRQKSN